MKTRKSYMQISWWKILLMLLGPSLLLLPVLAFYITFKGTPHFFLHTLIGWDVALIVLLSATVFQFSASRLDGLLLLGLALYALTPDFIYRSGPFHRDWMDVFLFHVSLDETLPFVLPLLILLWIVLLSGYFLFRIKMLHAPLVRNKVAREPGHPTVKTLFTLPGHHLLNGVLSLSIFILLIFTLTSVIKERTTSTPFVQTGQLAPLFALPSTSGHRETLITARGRTVLLAFVPSVLCHFCQQQLQAIQQLQPELYIRGIVVFVISTDTLAVQRMVATRLGLQFPLLSEEPTLGQHPAGSAYGVYHIAQQNAAPVDANALIVIDAKGLVRAVRIEPDHAFTTTEIFTLVTSVSNR